MTGIKAGRWAESRRTHGRQWIAGVGMVGAAFLLLSGPAQAAEFLPNDCFSRSIVGDPIVARAGAGDYGGGFENQYLWARTDTFTFDDFESCSDDALDITTISVILKTPSQTGASVDDLEDEDANGFAEFDAVEDALEASNSAFDHWGENWFNEVGAPDPGDGSFVAAAICIGAIDAATLTSEACRDETVPALLMSPAGGGTMIFSVSTSLNVPSEGSFRMTTLAISDATDTSTANKIPEAVLGWNLDAAQVPEPALAPLLIGALGVALRSRARHR